MRKAIENVVAGENPVNSSPLEILLHGLSWIYAAAVKARLAAYRSGIFNSRQLPCKVISIGNITVGGTGKTPFTICVAELIRHWDLRAVVISRGYKGDAERHGAVVSDGNQLLVAPQAAGDEPFLIAARLLRLSVPVLVGHDRINMGLQAVEKFHPDVILLDDGFQHIRLMRDVDVLLLDSRRPFGNSHLLPRGVLREPLSSLRRADLFVLTRSAENNTSGHPDPVNTIRLHCPQRPVFRAAHRPVLRAWIEAGHNPGIERLSDAGSLEDRRLEGCRVFAFSGIADNDAFRQSLIDHGITVSGFMEFADHHAYSPDDLNRVRDAAQSTDANCLCTTEKDWVKLAGLSDWPLAMAVMGVDISLGQDTDGFEAQLRSRLHLDG